MTFIIHYIIALTLGLLGWQMKAPQFEERLETLSNVSECMQTNKEIEKSEIDPDTFILFKDFRIDVKAILTND